MAVLERHDIAPDWGLGEKVGERLQHPKVYWVIIHNDDYTTMEFVVEILSVIFHHPPEVAEEIMLRIHQKGMERAGKYIYDIAKTKIEQVYNLAKANEFPLKCTIEEV